MGGLLARPATQYPKLVSSDGLFGLFPYLAPSLFGVSFIALSIVLSYFFIEETPKKEKLLSDGTIEEKPPLTLRNVFKQGFMKMFALCSTNEGLFFSLLLGLWLY
jgi:hypothetical protein